MLRWTKPLLIKMCVMRLTDADVEKFKDLLKHSEPTYHECMPPPDQLSMSSLDARYILYSVHEFDVFLNALQRREEHIARYVLTASGELCFGHEGEPGQSIPEHWQMLGDDSMIIAAGNIFIKDNKITSLNDQSRYTTGLLSLVYTLRALHKNELPLALHLELIQSRPDHHGEYSSFMTRADLQKIIGYHDDFAHDADDDPADEDDIFIDGLQEKTTLSDRPSTPHPFGPFGFFYKETEDGININRGPSQTPALVDVPETKTTEGVAQTW